MGEVIARIVLDVKKVRNGDLVMEVPLAEVLVIDIAGYTHVVLKHRFFKAWFPPVVSEDTKVPIPKKYLKYFSREVFPEVVPLVR